MGSAGGPARAAGRYMAGLCVAALGVCAGGWLVLTPFAFGYPGHGRAAVTALATGGGLVVVCAVCLCCWAALWRSRLRADGVLPVRRTRRSRRSARRQARAERLVRATRQRELVTAPDPAQVLTDLRALLTPLLGNADGGAVDLVPAPANGSHDMDRAKPAPVEAVEVPEAVEVREAVEVPQGVEEPGIDPAPRQDQQENQDDGQIPVHLRGTRSESFFAGAELLMVGTGEEEAW